MLLSNHSVIIMNSCLILVLVLLIVCNLTGSIGISVKSKTKNVLRPWRRVGLSELKYSHFSCKGDKSSENLMIRGGSLGQTPSMSLYSVKILLQV